jgi:hypothetical protein
MKEEKARTVDTVVTEGLNTSYNVSGHYYFKRDVVLRTFILPAVATLHVARVPKRVEMVQRSELYPGPPSKTPTVPTVASVR